MNLLGLLIIGVSVLKCVSTKTRPVPIHGAKEIEKILSRHLQFDGSLFNFIKGTQGNETEGLNYADENLDVNILDMKTFRKILNLAKQKYKQNYRRQNVRNVKPLTTTSTISTLKTRAYRTGGFKTHERVEPYTRNVSMFIIVRDKIFDFMLQSIYATKERIQDTKRIRQHFRNDPRYKLAILYQTCAHHMNKMHTLFAQLRYFHAKTYFLWYLIIYERILQSSIDIEYATGRIYQLDIKSGASRVKAKGEQGGEGGEGEEGEEGEERQEGAKGAKMPELISYKDKKQGGDEPPEESNYPDFVKQKILLWVATSTTEPTGPPPTKKLNAAEMAGGRLDYEWKPQEIGS